MIEPDIIYPPGRNIAVLGDGAVVPIGPRQLSPSEIVSQIKDAVALPYMGVDPKKIGMSLLEAAIFSAAEKAADGDLDALEKLLNRLMGKPMQTVVSATGTLKEFLDGLANPDAEPSREVDPLSS
jgi:hypothetical protein